MMPSNEEIVILLVLNLVLAAVLIAILFIPFWYAYGFLGLTAELQSAFALLSSTILVSGVGGDD